MTMAKPMLIFPNRKTGAIILRWKIMKLCSLHRREGGWFKKKIERTEEVLKNYRNYGESWWISGVVFSAKLEGRNFSFFQVCQFSQETWILIKSKYFSHTSCNKSLILFIYQNCLYIVKACENDFYPHQSWYFWLTFFLMSLSFQKSNKNIV